MKVNIYLVKKNGVEKEAKITEIMKHNDVSPHAQRFSDSVYLGEVVRWIRAENLSMLTYKSPNPLRNYHNLRQSQYICPIL